MPLYELLLIAKLSVKKETVNYSAHLQDQAIASQLLKFCAKYILDNKGVVRKFGNLGTKALPYKMKKHQEIFERGSYYTMKFDCAPATIQSLSKALKLNESVIRHSMVKLGECLTAVTQYEAPESIINKF